jgi:glycosyltransferase involved in cell wall biosynthesis
VTTSASSSRPGILLIGNYPPPFGGVPRHLEDLVPHLVSSGWDVHVLSGGASGIHRGSGFTIYKDSRSALPRRLGTARFLARTALSKRRGPAFMAARRLPPGTWVRTMTRVSLAADIIERNDIRVISAYNLLLGAPVGAIAAEMYRIPLVVTNLGEIYSHRSEVDRQVEMIRHIIRIAGALMSLTRHCASSYRELGMNPEVKVLHYGIDHERFAGGAGDAIRTRLGIPPTSDVVLFVGRMVRDMGLHVLLDGLSELLQRRPTVHVLIVGGSGELRQEAEDAAAGWPGRVTVIADVHENDLPGCYAAATIVVAPTIGARACGSLAAAEAMAAGKAVVATRIGGIPEYVGDGETGLLIPPGDSTALVNALVSLLGDRDRLSEFGRAARERVRRLFDNQRTNDAIERLFRDVAGIR